MLAKQGIISKSDAAEIRKGLVQVQGEIEAGTFTFSRALEDIHLNVELRLKDIIGPAAGRLHTARSRNDQVALDFRLYVRDTVDHFDAPASGAAGGARREGRGPCRDHHARLYASAGGPAGYLRPSYAGLRRDAGA